MIERASEFGASAAMPLLPADTSELSAGQMLRQAREAHSLHIEAVAAALKVPAQKLAALESDNIDALPDPVFARALAASMCRALRMDPAPVLEKLPGATRAVLAEADRSISGNIRDQAQRSSARAGLTGRPSRPLLAVVGLLLVGAVVILFLPSSATEQMAATWSRLTGGAQTESAAPTDGAGVVLEPTVVGPAVQAADSVMAEVQAPAAPPADTAPEDVAPADTAQADAAPAAAAPADTLVFVARGESWIRVSGPGGKTVMERLLQAGETASLAVQPPLSVTVGRASAVDVQVKGQALDLAPLTRSGGVARFEVAS